jgi:hypothetical protein
MTATELLAELRPPLTDDAPEDVLERILLAGPEPPRRRRRRPLAAAAAIAVAVTAAVALLPGNGDVGLSRAVAALSEPNVLLHFKVTTTHLPSGAIERAETWQTPDGRRVHARYNGIETAYDQRAKLYEVYVPERDEVLIHTTPEVFEDKADPFGSIATYNVNVAGDLPGLLQRALDGNDPAVRHVGRTTIRGIDVDQIRVERHMEIADAPRGASPAELRKAPTKTVTTVRDIYVRHDNALPVRVVDQLEAFGNPENTRTVSDYTDAQKLTLVASTERSLRLPALPGVKRTVRPPFDDSKAR